MGLRMQHHHPIVMLLIAFVLAFAFAIAWVIVMTLTLPPTDGAYGEAPFEDPLVIPVMSILASIAAVFVSPFLYFALRDRPLPKSLAILAGTVLAEIVCVTPLNAPLGFIGALLAFAVGLLAAMHFTAA